MDVHNSPQGLDKAPSPWGSHLFTPANNAGFLTGLPLLGARSVILDIEYATSLDCKHEGRLLAAGAITYLRELLPSDPLRITVRVNMPACWPVLEADLDAIVPASPDCIRVPAVEFPEQIEQVARHLDGLEQRHAITDPIALHPMIENPDGLARIDAIAASSARITALAFGGEDWAHNVGAQRTPTGAELAYPRQVIVAAAARAGVAAIDTVYNWLDDEDGFQADCVHSRQLGFHGRATINPRQLPSIDRIYQPSDPQRAWARRLLAGLSSYRSGDHPVPVSNGVILDPLAVTNARRIVDAGAEGSDA